MCHYVIITLFIIIQIHRANNGPTATSNENTVTDGNVCGAEKNVDHAGLLLLLFMSSPLVAGDSMPCTTDF